MNMATSHQTKGLTRVDVLIVAAVGIFVLCLAPAISQQMKSDASRTVCKANLAAIGKAMLTYTNDNNGSLPRAGGRNTEWYQTRAWDAKDRRAAFGLAADGTGGQATISSSLYLLAKYMGLEPRRFVCPGDNGTTEFKLADVPGIRKDFTLSDAWDFGPDAYKHCSYAYQIPYNLYCLTTWNNPSMPVAADRNPWIASPAGKVKDWASFKPDIEPMKGTAEDARKGNSLSHGQDGQNVLFLDGHVSFEERPWCGIDKDNIYTVSRNAAQGDAWGTPPIAETTCCPANRNDSLLVHDPELVHEEVTRQAPSIDSKSLRQTAVVATLDCPLPEHKNVIWCSTFQMAWDKFKEDIIGEPIHVIGAEAMANRLNQAQFPIGAIEEKSYYVAAGFVDNGIIERIQNEMPRRFPSEPVPVFDGRYKTLPEVAVAFAYLNVDVGFAYPYYTRQGAFSFEDSNGTRTGVTAFSAQNQIEIGDYQKVRDQVEVLFYDEGDTPAQAEFAVDLCKHTKPYQVVLARMPRSNTLGEAARIVQEKAAEFKTDPDYETLRKLRTIDTLIVPDVLFKLTHHFDELLGKFLGNAKWQRHFFFEAVQKIDFTLSRTGVILKSEARLGSASGRPGSRNTPRHLHFDRPFLIYVKMRDAGAPPFFVMWVDNAELMKRY